MCNLGNVPQIKFQHVNHTDDGSEVQYFVVSDWHGTELDLTATIVSISNLTSLNWSFPYEFNYEEFNHDVTIFSDGNTTNTTLMLYKTTNLAGVYSLSAGNKCGKNSVKLEVSFRKTGYVHVVMFAYTFILL